MTEEEKEAEDQLWPNVEHEWFIALKFTRKGKGAVTTDTFVIAKAKTASEARDVALKEVYDRNPDLDAHIITSMNRV